MSSVPPRWFAVVISAMLSALAAIVGFTTSAGLTGSIVAATVGGVIGAGVAGIVLRRLRRSHRRVSRLPAFRRASGASSRSARRC